MLFRSRLEYVEKEIDSFIAGIFYGFNRLCLCICRLTPRECLRLQGWADDRIDKILVVSSERQAYRQAGNGVTVNVVEAIGKRLAAIDAELCGG